MHLGKAITCSWQHSFQLSPYLNPSLFAGFNDILGANVIHSIKEFLVVIGWWGRCTVENCAYTFQSWVQVLESKQRQKKNHSCFIQVDSLLTFPVSNLGHQSITDNHWARPFIEGGRGLHVETTQLALMVVLKLGHAVVWSASFWLFQSRFVPISLRPLFCGSLCHD